MLRLHQYRKSYDGRPLLTISELRLDAGVWWLQGPNGAGKSTLLRSIGGLEPFEGAITVNGLDLRRQRTAYCKSVSWAEAEPQYPAFVTGAELLDFYRSLRGGTAAEQNDWLQALGAESYQHTAVGTWSSGMLKKLSLVLAFTGSPAWVLLDEPMATLDAAAQEAALALIGILQRKGVSFLITSHQPLEALRPRLLRLREQTVFPEPWAC